jgi:phospholipid/cholesterol/gamma-HCH transport system substrate-binding protein
VITRRTKVQLMVFVLITLLGVSFVGARYAQIDRLFFDDSYTVTASFAESGGIFTGAEVTYRGKPVGRVGTLHLEKGGVLVDLDIDKSVRVPADVKAVVANRSAIGEQYVDLQPRDNSAPYLKDGSRIDRKDTELPITTTELLVNLDQLVNSVDRDDLRVTVKELGDALRGKGGDLQKIIDSSGVLINEADANVNQTLTLIKDGNTVLAGQIASGDHIKQWAENVALLSDQLSKSDADLRAVIDNGTTASEQVTGLINENRADIAVLLGNLLTMGQITAVRLDGIEQLLIIYPAVVMGGYIVPARDPATGHYDAHFGLVVSSDPPACREGYGGTDKRVPQDTGDIRANDDAGCTADPSTGVNVRGAQNHPRPRSSVPLSRVGLPASYDPATREVDPGDGVPAIMIGSTGGQQRLLGKDSWKWLMLGPVTK